MDLNYIPHKLYCKSLIMYTWFLFTITIMYNEDNQQVLKRTGNLSDSGTYLFPQRADTGHVSHLFVTMD